MLKAIAMNTRKAIGTVAAVAIVSASGLVLDQAHLAAAPRGIVEVGELAPVGGATTQLAALPEVVVRAKREDMPRYVVTTELPEIVVVAKRAAQFVAKDEAKREVAPAISAGF